MAICPWTVGRGEGGRRRAILLTMIESHSLTKRYGGRAAVQDVSFSCQTGTVTGFLGPNGAGKVHHHEACIVRPDPGRPPGRRPFAARRFADLTEPRPARSASCSTPRPMHAGRTGREIAHAGGSRTLGMPAAGASTSHARAGQPGLLGRRVASAGVRHYSLGMRQRLGIAARPDRRPAGADPRRAGQRAWIPSRHPLDARPAARTTPTAAARCCSPRTCCTRSRPSPTGW